MKIDINQIEDIEVDGVDPADWPDLCDSFFGSAVWKDSGKDLSDEELDDLTEQYPDLLQEMASERAL